jgi:hypothetical protein
MNWSKFTIQSKFTDEYSMSAGARLTVILLSGNGNSEFLIAADTLSRDSLTAESGRPTIKNMGTAFSRCVSI